MRDVTAVVRAAELRTHEGLELEVDELVVGEHDLGEGRVDVEVQVVSGPEPEQVLHRRHLHHVVSRHGSTSRSVVCAIDFF
ncbi:MAG: hypothetical protein HOQ27_09315 [Dermatophilaceae bacterium]|nr:hypothetical protein [Dermatophilaceae bacterium]NUR80399.1 hypothetical protein [Dermatophilaceae bacterium]